MRVRWFVSLQLLFAFSLLAVSAPALAAPNANPGKDGELMLVQFNGRYGPLVAYEIATQKPAFKLPAGMLSTDRSVFYSSEVDAGKTVLKAFDIIGRSERFSLPLDGDWHLRGVSPNGNWLALIEEPSESERASREAGEGWTTNIKVIDAASGETTDELSLQGHHEIDTISNDGRSLFLTQYVPAGDPEHYWVRLFDLSVDELNPNPLKDKRNQDEVMTGLAWNGLATPNGVYQLTLYLNTDHDMAFIHTLNLDERWPICVFLPSGTSDVEDLKGYRLTLSPDGLTAYATNAAMGLVAEISMSTLEVTHVEAFDAAAGSDHVSTTISPDGESLFFSSGKTIWAYDAETKTITGTYEVSEEVIALYVTADGRTLIAASDAESSPLTAIDPMTGTVDSYWGT